VNNTNNQSARDSYNQARKLLYDAWINDFMAKSPNPGNPMVPSQQAKDLCWQWVNSRKLSQGDVRLEVELNNTSNTFTFGVTSQQPNSTNVVFPTEKRLQQADTLISPEFKIFVGAPASRADTTFRLRTYGNTVDFNAAQAAALDGEFYDNGGYTVKVGGDTIIPYRGLYNHHYIPQTQQTAVLGAGSPNDQFRGAEDGSITEEPNILFIGSKAYIPQIVLNTALVPAMGFTRAILIYSGLIAQNSTVIS
jgi:hypothetical protein